MGMRHVFSITDKHVNGTNRSNKEVLRHLRAIVYDTRVIDVFTNPTVIQSVQYIMNSHASSEVSDSELTPLELTFGARMPFTWTCSNRRRCLLLMLYLYV
jgi:hypothetical protein